MTESELRIRVLTDQLAEARRIADNLAEALQFICETYQGVNGPKMTTDAAVNAIAATTSWVHRSWRPVEVAS